MCTEKWLKRSRQRGVSLIELILFIVIISGAIVGVLSVMNIVNRSSADPMVRKQAIAMAEAILEEVLAKDATATLPETDLNTCANRALYVGVADYACFDGNPATAVIQGNQTLGATAIPALAGFRATVAVAPMAAVSGVNLRRVAVTVAGGNETITLFGYRAAGL